VVWIGHWLTYPGQDFSSQWQPCVSVTVQPVNEAEPVNVQAYAGLAGLRRTVCVV